MPRRAEARQIHATAVAIGGVAVLLRGPSGSGKSDLALRLIQAGAILVADDRCDLSVAHGRLFVSAPAAIRGLLEVRGLGILPVRHRAKAPVSLVVDLVKPGALERLPPVRRCCLQTVTLPLLRLAPFEASAPAKVVLAVRSRGKGVGSAR
jgi:serine kinase of HPr protein (carbohydrate metabolism regulator)